MKISTALLFVFFQVNLFSQANPAAILSATEICDNELDDDGDGLIDCYDVQDCPCDTAPDCVVTSLSSSFGMQAAWISPQDDFASWVTPLVGNLNPAQDSIPEIIVFKAVNILTTLNTEMVFYKGDGSDQNNPPRMTVPGSFSDPSIADLDRDGDVELFMLDDEKHIRIYHGYDPAANPAMQLWVISTEAVGSEFVHLYAADFDSDGISEIYVGNEVYALDFSNPGTPQLRRVLKGTGPAGAWLFFHTFYNSFAADLLDPADCGGDPDCNGLEIAAGFVIYSIDLDPNDGDGVQIKIQRNIRASSGQNFSDGSTAVADVNLDGILDVVVAGKLDLGGPINGLDDPSGVYVWDKTGYWRFMVNPNLTPLNHEETGIITIGNVYDDTQMGFAEDWPEIMNTNDGRLNCYNLHAANNPANPIWWSVPTQGLFQHSGATIFDFNNDGVNELVFQNDPGVHILYGGGSPFPAGLSGSNRSLASYNSMAQGNNSMAVIADVDADDEAEIVVIGGKVDPNTLEYSPYGSLYVLESNRQNHRAWMPARDIWNQHSYNVVNINDDLTVPIVQQEGHLQIPAGSGKRPLNMFGFQAPKYGRPVHAYLPTADLQLELVSKSCNGTSLNITMRICNKGSIPFRDSMFLSFYRFGNPFSGNAIRGGTYLVRTTPFQPDSCLIFNVTLPNAPITFYFLLNDAGDTQIPLPGNLVFYTPECNYQNNHIQFNGYPKPTLNLGPDRTGCPPGGHTFIAGNGFATFLWQDGSTAPLFTAFASGKYWVEATDFCANVRRDTVEVFSNAVMQTLQASACAGDSYVFDGQSIPAGSSQTFQYTSTLGCDSTIVVMVGILPADTSSEIRQICPGDSTLIFGNFVSAAGTFQQTNPNINGCDSTHTVTVDLFPAPQNTQEQRQICPGDSTLVFGSFVSAAGTFQQINPNINGCDSMHTITVDLFPAPQNTQEQRLICPGDSTLVFGSFVSAAGTFQQINPNTNGCDSMHTITVDLFPTPQNTQEQRQICPGDSTFVFGSFVSTAGTFQQTNPNINGCDSTHTITVDLFPAP
ncbi:MAG: VCBS repeat-containing protein, partial [Saprospiraceae bacterium]|nr:VCBS repeat-containing protein [Saprospiraceae bacterium]